jgi:DNA-binding transcriptional MerR regulator
MINKSENLFEELSSIHSMIDQIEDFKQKTNSIIYSARDLSIAPRFVNQWKGKGLLFKEIVKGSTNNYSFLDCVWLKCIEKMRKFGVEFKIIHSFREKLLYTFNKVDIQSMLHKGVIDVIKSKNQGLSENEILEILKNINPSDFNVQINLLELVIYDMFINKLTYTFKINEDGDFYFIKEGNNSDNIEITDASEVFLSGSYFNLSLSEILSSIFFEGISFEFIAEEKMSMITNDELTILKSIRDPSVTKIELIFDKKKSEILKIMHATKKEKFYAEKRVSDYIFKNRYNTIIITAHGKEQVFVENVHKTKFKK